MALSGRVMLALLVILGLHSVTATQYTVGGNDGWTFQSTNTVYTDQFADIQLVVGDTLLFPFTVGEHDVWEIPTTDLSSCNFANPIQTYNDSDSIVTLTTAGTHAFACQIAGHCTSGMQLSVTVLASAPTAAPSSPPTPAPVAPPTSAPVSPPTPAPVSPPTPAPVSPPTPAPVSPPTPAPVSPPSATPVTTPTPAAAPTPSEPVTEAPAPGPAVSGSSIISSGSAMVVAAIVAGFALLSV